MQEVFAELYYLKVGSATHYGGRGLVLIEWEGRLLQNVALLKTTSYRCLSGIAPNEAMASVA